MEKEINFQPIGLNILVKPEENPTTSRMGVVLVNNTEERPTRVKVIALGTGVIMPNGLPYNFSVKVGDVVYLRNYGGSEIKIDEETYLVVTENEILGVFK